MLGSRIINVVKLMYIGYALPRARISINVNEMYFI